MDQDITKQKVWTTAHMITAIIASISFTFATAVFISDMRHVETEQTFLENTHAKDIEIINKRMDKREDRNGADRKALWAEINQLKKKNSDAD